MPTQTEKYNMKLARIEKGKEKTLRVFFSYPLGETSIETEGKNIVSFNFGKKYEGIFKVSGIPDFIGQKDKWKNVCTMSYTLEKILDDGKVIYEKN
ncbi:MAG: hypothetical protein AABX88_02080 [Nanoarchaeota archaeon]